MTEELAVYPASLLLRGRPVLVVGGGRVALRKVEGLVAAAALVTVVAPEVCMGIAALAGPRSRGEDRPARQPSSTTRDLATPAGASAGGSVKLERRHYRRGEVADYRLAFTATGLPEVDRAVFEDGERAGVFVNAADDPPGCSFHVPSVVRRGPVTIAISTNGTSPALAAWLRARIEEAIGPEYEQVAGVLQTTRAEVRRQRVATETLDWDDLIARLLDPPAGEPPATTAAGWLAGD